MESKRETPSFAALLKEAIETPGRISEAYSLFHAYSIGNACAALFQCYARGIRPGPIATFPKWKERGRFVRKGEKAIVLCQPVTKKREETNPQTGETTEHVFNLFVWRPSWFVLSQTDGPDFPAETVLPDWNEAAALSALGIEKMAFEHVNGNVQGYASGRAVAVSPLAYNPARTLVHEMAHVVLGHTQDSILNDEETLCRTEREMEAEGVAYVVGSILGISGLEYSRGYLQSWAAGKTFGEKMAARIFKTADTILKAGRPAPQPASDAN